MQKNILVSIIISLTLGACDSRNEAKVDESNSKGKTNQRTENLAAPSVPDANGTITYSGDSLQYLALDSFELVSYRITSDTLQLVSTSDFLYHPFGRFSGISSFKKRHSSIILRKEIDSSDNTAEIYRATFGSSFVKLFLDDEEKKLEIISGAIVSSEIKTNNGIKVGMKRRSFFACFFKKPSSVEKKNIKVIELISGLDEIRHYYTFQEDALLKIEFDTDYQFNAY